MTLICMYYILAHRNSAVIFPVILLRIWVLLLSIVGISIFFLNSCSWTVRPRFFSETGTFQVTFFLKPENGLIKLIKFALKRLPTEKEHFSSFCFFLKFPSLFFKNHFLIIHFFYIFFRLNSLFSHSISFPVILKFCFLIFFFSLFILF